MSCELKRKEVISGKMNVTLAPGSGKVRHGCLLPEKSGDFVLRLLKGNSYEVGCFRFPPSVALSRVLKHAACSLHHYSCGATVLPAFWSSDLQEYTKLLAYSELK